MKNRTLYIIFAVFVSGCTSQGAWKAYSPVMSGIVGLEARMYAGEIVIGNRIQPVGEKNLEIVSRDGSSVDSRVEATERHAALDFVSKNISLNIGASDAINITTNATGASIDLVDNWAWMPIDQTFVYGGLRANSATIDFTSKSQISTGKLVLPKVGEVNLSAKTENTYHAEVTNPVVYYRVQLAKVKETFPGLKYSSVWINDEDPDSIPIRLSERESDKSETRPIKPYQWFWRRWLGSEMPSLTLVVNKSDLFVRSTRGRDSKLMPLAPFENDGKWNERSAYVGDFSVGDFEKKFIVLDIKADRDGDDIVIKHARIRYPEVKLDLM